MCYDMIYWCINWTQYIDWFIIWHGTVHKWSWTILQVLLKTYIRKHFLLVKQIKTCAKTLCVFLSYQPLGGEGEVGVVGWGGGYQINVHDDVIKWKHFLRHCMAFVWGIPWSPVNSPHKGDRWTPLTKASDAELWCSLWSAPQQTVE